MIGLIFRPATPPALLISSIVIRATSLSEVSDIAMVPESECRMPTLIGSALFWARSGCAAKASVPESNVAWRNNFLFMGSRGKNRHDQLAVTIQVLSTAVAPRFRITRPLIHSLQTGFRSMITEQTQPLYGTLYRF